jgi:hypothetical protein
VPGGTFEINLAELTGYQHLKFNRGDWIILYIEELDVNIKMRLVKMTEDHDNSENVQLEFGSKMRDLSDELSKIKSKQNTWDRFPQRAPNLYVANKEENVDPTHPLVLRFPIPTQVLKTTRVLLSLRGLALQYFSQVSGASSISTSAAGGNSTETASWFAFLQRILETVAIEDPGVAYDQHSRYIRRDIPPGRIDAWVIPQV